MMTLQQFNNTIDRLEEARLLMAALEFKVFTALGNKKLTARQVATRTKTQPEGMTALLNALAAMKALRYERGRYANAPQMYKYFCETSPHYLEGTAYLSLERNDEWARLIQTIRKGRDLSEYRGPDNTEHRRKFSFAMHERSEAFAGKIAGIITQKPAGRFLDLGCGPGSYSAAVLKKDRKATATLLDRSAALRVARELHGDRPFFKRMAFLPGDLYKTPYGGEYDTVFYSNILHIYDPGQNLEIFRKIHKALVKGGRLILVDFFHTKDQTQPYDAALFGVTMQLFTATGKTYSFDETEKLLSRAGFHRFRRKSLEGGNGMLFAVKK
ncbi:MAG: methyltransferase domain-containing protein [Nitrospinaceae bacterium]|nr:methyltransferase domain-containing protein [Nitrospinaceae bacterium]NIR56348.1 methyltransferase domain-containing protein [Nitrospinaceae bacterium]NIS86808.1 methyltransferase domain-containing protein [Nitrospinaceae bacterium]NIT83642.1 methyltransferase domain-containing protein [Nitrospinaceae bacterium]NIU45845.1 methyltransferase domain-containing protein [Nitrospinaceae bacterium]